MAPAHPHATSVALYPALLTHASLKFVFIFLNMQDMQKDVKKRKKTKNEEVDEKLVRRWDGAVFIS